MSDPKQAADTKRPLSLAATDTPEGAMERNFLAETNGPETPSYDANADRDQMRDMRQAIENRLKHPAIYKARGAQNEIDILKAPGQFAGFANYPELPKNEQTNITEDLAVANAPQNPLHIVYMQHVEDAITAATESIVHPVAGFPDATA